MGNKVMSVRDRDDCIGCEACARTCAKKCYTHAPVV
jgi:NAD-dependent dihydropyrimidine dehydrogenase PreA subunit